VWPFEPMPKARFRWLVALRAGDRRAPPGEPHQDESFTRDLMDEVAPLGEKDLTAAEIGSMDR